MTLKEKFDNLDTESIFYHDSDNCKKIADDFAIEFAEWNSYKYKYLKNKGWFNGSYQLEMGIFLSSKELLEMYKKEKGL